MKKLVVLITGPSLKDPGGVANYYNAVFPRISNDAVEAHYLEIGSTQAGGWGKHVIADQVRFWRALEEFKPDIVHLNPSLNFRSFIRDGLFSFLAKIQRRKVLVFFRGWQKRFESRVSGLLKPFFSISYGRADAFIVLAQEFCESLRKWGVTAPISISSTTVDDQLLADFSIGKKASHLEEAKTIRLLYLARIERHKGVLELVNAVKLLLEEGADISLTIAGDGSIIAELRALISTLGINQKSVSLIGYVRGEEKVKVLESHHIYCFPTQYGEGMPNSVLEAMAFGLPVITCPVGGIADFFEDGKMGVLLAGTEPPLIASAITALLLDYAKMADIAQYNYTYARRRFLASTVADFLREHYAHMLLAK